MTKMIDGEKVIKWLHETVLSELPAKTEGYDRGKEHMVQMLTSLINSDSFDPTPPVQPDTPKHGDRVLHGIHGMGTVVSGVYVPAPTVIVDLDNNARFHPLPITELEVITDDPTP